MNVANALLQQVLLSLYQSRFNLLYSQYVSYRCKLLQDPMFYNNTSVCINPYTMVYIFLYVYSTDTTRSRTQCSTIILQSVSTRIRRSMNSFMFIVQIQLTLEPRLVRLIIPQSVSLQDTTLYVFLQSVSLQDTTLYVFLQSVSVFQNTI